MKTAALLLVSLTALAKDTPAWVLEAARQTTRTDYPAKAGYVVLLDEEHLTVDPEGRRTMRERRAVKVLQQGSRVSAFRSYDKRTGRIRELRAWLIAPDGKETEYPKSRVMDVSLADAGSYDESRAKVLECGSDAVPGAVFAYEAVEEEDTIFTTFHHGFQGSMPVVTARFVLALPPGWEARGTVFNRDGVSPQVSGETWTWELRDLPYIEPEERAPGYHARSPRLGLTYFPASAAKPELRPLKDWQAVSGWLTGLVDPPAAVSDPIREKAAQLTGSARSDLEKIRAVAEFVQSTLYVSIQLNVTHGGGYTPHDAGQVLTRNSGDCKDKSTLMRALLKAAGIDSHAVVIYWGDRRYVRPEWPSPMQFNHMVVAVKAPDSVKAPSILEHPRLGRLMIFDPTDATTAVGDLDDHQQGSYALVLAGAEGDLVKVPELPAEASRTETTVEAEMTAEGGLRARTATRYFGQSAASMRRVVQQGTEETRRELERSVSRRVPGVQFESVSAEDRKADGHLTVSLAMNAPSFGQLMQGRLLVFKPGTLVPNRDYRFAAAERQGPIELDRRVHRDRVTVKVPAGFALDEAPDPVALDTPYGVYQAQWKAAGPVLTFEQSLEVRRVLAPVSEYRAVKEFFEAVAGSQAAPVVLLRR